MSPGPRHLLVVDDDARVAEAHATLLRQLGYRVTIELSSTGVEALIGRCPDIELALLDLQMPGMTGIELLRRLRVTRPHIGVVIATVVNDIDEAVKATKSGAYAYLLKPLQPERLREVLDAYFGTRPSSFANEPFLSTVVTQSSRFQEIFRRIRAFSATNNAVLVQGETGTGKELIANLIHSSGATRAEPFVAVNVAALSPQLFESELFGHRRGAFTGAVTDRGGYIEEAGEGTLFLDEIGELGAEEQKKLLRVVETRRYCRVGETKERPVQARIVCASNRNLEGRVAEGKFRSDLFYRVSSLQIVLPPLRERQGDIPLLADYFFRKYCAQYGRSLEGFSPDALALLEQYNYPGNVRELEGIVSAAVLLELSPQIQAETLPERIRIVPPERFQGAELEVVRYKTIMEAEYRPVFPATAAALSVD